MSTIVTIKSTAAAVVISERIVDEGRERFENGRDALEPGVAQDFIVHPGQSVRVVELPVQVEAATTNEEAVQE